MFGLDGVYHAVAEWFLNVFCRNSGAAGLSSMFVLNFFSNTFLTVIRVTHTQIKYILNLNLLTTPDVLMLTVTLTHFLKSRTQE